MPGQDRRGKSNFEVIMNKKDGQKRVVFSCGHLDFPNKKHIGTHFPMVVTQGKFVDLNRVFAKMAIVEGITLKQFKTALPNCPPC